MVGAVGSLRSLYLRVCKGVNTVAFVQLIQNLLLFGIVILNYFGEVTVGVEVGATVLASL